MDCIILLTKTAIKIRANILIHLYSPRRNYYLAARMRKNPTKIFIFAAIGSLSTDNCQLFPYLAPLWQDHYKAGRFNLTSGLNCFCFLIVLPVIVLPQFYCKFSCLLKFDIRSLMFRVLSHLLFLSVGCRCSLPMRRSTFGVRRLPAVSPWRRLVGCSMFNLLMLQ